MGLYKHKIQSIRRQQWIDITQQIQNDIDIQEGIVVVYLLNSTCGITVSDCINQNICNDMIYGYEKVYPTNDSFYHANENSSAHMKSSALGCNQSFIVHQGKLILGVGQAIYFCEFDGPSEREYIVKIMQG